MERMTVYRLMEWLSNKPAGAEVVLVIPGADGPVNITGMDTSPEANQVFLETEDVTLESDEDED